MNHINEQVFRFLNGEWNVSRKFEGSYRGSFNGKVQIRAKEKSKAPTYHYHEEGVLTDAENKSFDAKQSYLYSLEEGRLQVLKQEDSKWIVMHDLDFKQDAQVASASHLHLCGQDHYAVEYRIDLSGTWEVDYTVTGPKKDYRINSLYQR